MDKQIERFYPIKCAGVECSNRETCLRFIAPSLENQTYGGFDKTEKPCLYYLPPIDQTRKYRHWQGQDWDSTDKY